MSNSPRNQTIEEHGSVDAYFKNTLGTKDWSRDVESYVADTSFSSDFEHPILQERVLQFLTWQEETFPADPSVHAPQNFTKRNGAIWCNGKSESLTHCLKVSLFQGPMQMQIPWAG